MLLRPWHRLGMGVWDPHLETETEVETGAREWLSRVFKVPYESIYYHGDVAHFLISLTLYLKPACIIHPIASPLAHLLQSISYAAGTRTLGLPPGTETVSLLTKILEEQKEKCLALIELASPTNSQVPEPGIIKELANTTRKQGGLLIVDLGPLPAYQPQTVREHGQEALAFTEAPFIVQNEVRWLTFFHGPRPLIETLELLSPLLQAQTTPLPPEPVECFEEKAEKIRKILEENAPHNVRAPLLLPFAKTTDVQPRGSIWTRASYINTDSSWYEASGKALRRIIGACHKAGRQ